MIVLSLAAMKLCIVYVLVLLGAAYGGPAPDVTELKITDCNCNRCLVTQYGYDIHGSVIMKFNGGQVTCSKNAIIDFGSTIIGWNYGCSISGLSGGKFEVTYNNGHQICGKNYDKLTLNSCSGTPCSSFG